MSKQSLKNIGKKLINSGGFKRRGYRKKNSKKKIKVKTIIPKKKYKKRKKIKKKNFNLKKKLKKEIKNLHLKYLIIFNKKKWQKI